MTDDEYMNMTRVDIDRIIKALSISCTTWSGKISYDLDFHEMLHVIDEIMTREINAAVDLYAHEHRNDAAREASRHNEGME